MADLDQLRAALSDIPVVTDPAKVQLKSRDFYWHSPVLSASSSRCAPRSGGRAARRGRGDPRAWGLPSPRRAGHGARRWHRQLWPGDAAQRRRRARSLASRSHHRDRRRPGARAGRDQARADRSGLPGTFAPGPARASEHAQDGHDRRLRRGRRLGRRLDRLGHPARPRQHTRGARGHHGAAATSARAYGRRRPAGQSRLRHQRRDHRSRDAARDRARLGRSDAQLRRLYDRGALCRRARLPGRVHQEADHGARRRRSRSCTSAR